jgi:uncharacterized protein DUF6745
MAKRIDRLTKRQQDELPAIRDEWLAHGLSTQPADRVAAEKGVSDAYRAAGLEPPQVIVWLDSPLAGVIGTALVQRLLTALNEGGQVGAQVHGQVRGQVGAQVGAQVHGQVGGQVGAQVHGQVRGQVGAQVHGQVHGQVRGQVGGQVGGQVLGQVLGQVRGQVGAQVGGQVGGQVGAQVGAQVHGQVGGQVLDLYWRAIWGQHEAGWLSWIDTFRRFGLKACEPADGLIMVGKSAGWWWPLRGAVVLTERPSQLHRDDDGRLHCEDGAAVLYPDGWGVWAIHGVRVTQQIVERPGTLTVKEIREESNAEVRRVMIERFTPERYLRESDATLLDEVHEPPFPGLLNAQLWQTERPGDTPLVMVKCRNSSPESDGSYKDYWLRVDPELRPLLGNGEFGRPQAMTCHNALASTWGMRGDEYSPLVES